MKIIASVCLLLVLVSARRTTVDGDLIKKSLNQSILFDESLSGSLEKGWKSEMAPGIKRSQAFYGPNLTFDEIMDQLEREEDFEGLGNMLVEAGEGLLTTEDEVELFESLIDQTNEEEYVLGDDKAILELSEDQNNVELLQSKSLFAAEKTNQSIFNVKADLILQTNAVSRSAEAIDELVEMIKELRKISNLVENEILFSSPSDKVVTDKLSEIEVIPKKYHVEILDTLKSLAIKNGVEPKDHEVTILLVVSAIKIALEELGNFENILEASVNIRDDLLSLLDQVQSSKIGSVFMKIDGSLQEKVAGLESIIEQFEVKTVDVQVLEEEADSIVQNSNMKNLFSLKEAAISLINAAVASELLDIQKTVEVLSLLNMELLVVRAKFDLLLASLLDAELSVDNFMITLLSSDVLSINPYLASSVIAVNGTVDVVVNAGFYEFIYNTSVSEVPINWVTDYIPPTVNVSLYAALFSEDVSDFTVLNNTGSADVVIAQSNGSLPVSSLPAQYLSYVPEAFLVLNYTSSETVIDQSGPLNLTIQLNSTSGSLTDGYGVIQLFYTANTCTIKDSEFTLLLDGGNGEDVNMMCQSIGKTGADINSFNFELATNTTFGCLGGFSSAYIYSYWGNNYGGFPLALYTGNDLPGGAIAPPLTPNLTLPYLCQDELYSKR